MRWVIMCESVLSNQCIKKFRITSTVWFLTISQFTTALYWTLVQAQLILSVLSLRIYSYLWPLLIVRSFVARSLIFSNFRKHKFTEYSSVMYVLREGPMSVPLTFPGLTCIAFGSLTYHHVYIISCAFCQYSAFICFVWISEKWENISPQH
jgi:hypothetical protein